MEKTFSEELSCTRLDTGSDSITHSKVSCSMARSNNFHRFMLFPKRFRVRHDASEGPGFRLPGARADVLS